LKQKKAFLLSDIAEEKKLADSLSDKAEADRSISLFVKSNDVWKNIR